MSPGEPGKPKAVTPLEETTYEDGRVLLQAELTRDLSCWEVFAKDEKGVEHSGDEAGVKASVTRTLLSGREIRSVVVRAGGRDSLEFGIRLRQPVPAKTFAVEFNCLVNDLTPGRNPSLPYKVQHTRREFEPVRDGVYRVKTDRKSVV